MLRIAPYAGIHLGHTVQDTVSKAWVGSAVRHKPEKQAFDTIPH